MERKFCLADYGSFFMRFMLRHCPETADNYEIVSCDVETMQSNEPKKKFKQLRIWVNLRHLNSGAGCHLCLETLNMNVTFGDGWKKAKTPAQQGCYDGNFLMWNLLQDAEGQLILKLSLYDTMAYYANHTNEVLAALALVLGNEAVEQVYLRKVAPEPKMFNECAGYAWKLDDEQALFLFADGNAVRKVWTICQQGELSPCILKQLVRQKDGKFYYATENNVVVRNTQFISGKAINMYKSIILRRYPSAKFWEKPIPAVYFKDCWLVGEVKLMPDDCMLLLELVSGQVQAVEQSSFWQFGGLASPENTNFSWK